MFYKYVAPLALGYRFVSTLALIPAFSPGEKE